MVKNLFVCLYVLDFLHSALMCKNGYCLSCVFVFSFTLCREREKEKETKRLP